MKRIILYLAGILVSIILILISMTILGNTQILAPVMIVFSLYLFLGCFIKLCKMNEKLKTTVICAIDLLFWLP